MSIAAGARVTLASQWVRLTIQLAGFVVLSRLLTPADFGIVAMVTVSVTIATLFADFGLTFVGLQAPTLSQGEKSGLFVLNVVAGAVGAIVVVLSGPILAIFYGEPRVVALAAVLALPLLLTSVAVQFRVELNRRLAFRALAVQDVTSAAAGLIAAVGAAAAGWGYWALAAQVLTQGVVLLVLALVQAGWWPSKPAPLRELRHFVAFGSSSLLLQLVTLTSRSVDIMMVGRSQGPTELGYYSRASQLITLLFQQLLSPLTRVLLPRLSAAPDLAALNADLVRAQRVISYPLLAAVSLLAAVAPGAVVVLFGQDWAAAGVLVQILCVGAAFQAAGHAYYWAALARAKTGLLLLAELPGRVVMVGGSVVFASAGAWAVATVMSAAQVLIFVSSSTVMPRAGVGTVNLMKATARPALVCSMAFMVGYGLSLPLASAPLMQLLVSLSGWLVAAGTASLLVPVVRRDLSSALKAVRG